METHIITICPRPVSNNNSFNIKNTDIKISQTTKISFNNDILDFSLPAPCNVEPPYKVDAILKDDLNIIKIHDAIRAKFAYKSYRINYILYEIQKNNKYISNNKLNYIEYNKYKEKNIFLENEYKDIKSGKTWNDYIEKIQPLLNAYLPLASEEIKGVITITFNKEIKENSELINKRQQIISSYLSIAKNYLYLNIHPNILTIENCQNCDLPINNIDETDEKGIYICKCGYEKIIMSKLTTYRDSSCIDAYNRNNYDDLLCFIKRMDAYECKQDYIIPELLYIHLDNYFVSKNLPSSEIIKKYPLLPNAKKTGTSIRLLEKGLLETKNAFYYKDMELIAHKLWGWKAADLTLYRDKMIEDYKITQEAYKKIKNEDIFSVKERDSSLNINMRLFWHLSAVGYICDKIDFKFVTSRDSLEYHSKTFKKMCEMTNIKFTPII